jgi:hypothetical protein
MMQADVPFRGTPQYGSNKTKGQKRDPEADEMAYWKPSTL